MNARLNSLREKHAKIDQEITAMQGKPGVDGANVTALKKQKLALKDKMQSITADPSHA